MCYIVYRGGSYYLLRVHRRVARCSGTDFSTRVPCVTRVFERGKVGRMTTAEAIITVGGLIVVAMAWSKPVPYDYHTDLKNIAYQLSRIADALNRKAERREE